MLSKNCQLLLRMRGLLGQAVEGGPALPAGHATAAELVLAQGGSTSGGEGKIMYLPPWYSAHSALLSFILLLFFLWL